MANPQPDKYTQYSNELMEIIMKCDFNGAQHSIVYAVVRNTFGYKRKFHRMSIQFIAKQTGLHIKTVQKELKRLFQLNVLELKSQATNKQACLFGIHKNYDEWAVNIRGSQSATSGGSQSATSGGSQSATSGGSQSATSGGSQSATSVGVNRLPQATLHPNNEEDFQTPKERSKERSKENILKKDDKERNEKIAKMIDFYNRNIGILKDYISEQIMSYLDDGVEPELMLEYMKFAINQNADKWSYINKTARENLKKGIKTLAQYQEHEQKREEDKKKSSAKQKQPDNMTNFEKREYTDEELEKYYANINPEEV